MAKNKENARFILENTLKRRILNLKEIILMIENRDMVYFV
jgi:hypothetical protein